MGGTGIVVCLCLLAASDSFNRATAAPPASAMLGAAAVGQADFGTIKGRLVWGGDEVPPSKVVEEKGKAQKDPEVCAKDEAIISQELVVDPKTKGIAFGFAYIPRPKGANPEAVQQLVAKEPKVEFDQKNCQFAPHAKAMHQDQVLVLKSSDPVNHNVRFAAFTNQFNNILGPKGAMEVKVVAERFPIEVKCDIHPWMKGWLMVFNHPFFAVTNPDGTFEIRGVPAGAQNLVLWQETIGFVTPGKGAGMPVMVKAGEVVDVGDIKLGPKVNK